MFYLPSIYSLLVHHTLKDLAGTQTIIIIQSD